LLAAAALSVRPGGGGNPRPAFLGKRIRSLFLRIVRGFVVPGEAHRAFVRGLKAECPVWMAPNSVNHGHFAGRTEDYRPDREELRKQWGLKGPVILFVGRLTPGKGIFELLEAFERMPYPGEATLLVVGDGPAAAACRARCRSGLRRAVCFAGFRDQEALPRFYAMADLFVLPSRYDPWGLVLNEAMAAGLPVVGTAAAGASKDLIRDGENGYVFDAGDTERLSRVLGALAGDAALRERMGRQSRQIIEGYRPEDTRDGFRAAILGLSPRDPGTGGDYVGDVQNPAGLPHLIERIFGDDSGEPYYWLHLKRYAFAAGYCRGKRVLDAGCGTGYGTAYLAGHASEVIGLDADPRAVEYARARHAAPNVGYETGNAENASFPDASFDVVCVFEMIEHLEDYRAFLREAVRMLRPGGICLISTPSAKKTTRRPVNLYHTVEFSRRDFEGLLRGYFGDVRILGQRRRQTQVHYRLTRLLDMTGLRGWLSGFYRIRSAATRVLGTKTYEELTLEDWIITEREIGRAPVLIAVCRKPMKDGETHGL